MLELIQQYSLSEILIFLTIFGLAVKGLVTFYDWSVERLRKIFKKETDQENTIDDIQEQLNNADKTFKKIFDNQEKINESISDLTEKIDMLIKSDKDDIKSFITREHHYFYYEKKWIDDYSLDCIEKRYEHYKEEGGNSFIKDLMNEIRSLPKQPPQE